MSSLLDKVLQHLACWALEYNPRLTLNPKCPNLNKHFNNMFI